jgi:hypothetical protein
LHEGPEHRPDQNFTFQEALHGALGDHWAEYQMAQLGAVFGLGLIFVAVFAQHRGDAGFERLFQNVGDRVLGLCRKAALFFGREFATHASVVDGLDCHHPTRRRVDSERDAGGQQGGPGA